MVRLESGWRNEIHAAGKGERQQTMMSFVSDKTLVFHPEVTEESSGGFAVGSEKFIICEH